MRRYVRIAATALSATICLLVVVLWVRSYVWHDQFIRSVSTTEYMACTSAEGRIRLGKSDDPLLSAVFRQGWIRRGIAAADIEGGTDVAWFPASVSLQPRPWRFPWFSFNRNYYVHAPAITSYELILPYWMLAAVCTATAAVPWIKWRFSVRMLLLVVTIIGVLFALGTAFGP